MSLTGQQSSSRRKEKGPMEPLTPLQEKELENDSLRRQVYDFQQEIDEVRTENKDLKAEQMAKNEIIERLSNDLSRRELEIDSLSMKLAKRDWEIDSYKERAVQLRGYLDDLFGPVPLAASKKAETKERANPQFKQSGLHRHAEELKSQKMSTDTTEEEFKTVKDKKNKLADGSSSKAPAEELESQKMSTDTIKEEFKTVKDKKNKLADGSSSKAPVLAGSLSNKNPYAILDQDDPWKRPKLPKKAEVSNQNPADKMYVAPAPETKFATLTGTSGYGSGVFHGFKTLHSKEHSPVMQGGSAPQAPKLPPSLRNLLQPEDVRSSATPHEAESVKDYAQVAAEPSVPALVDEGWTDSPGLSDIRRGWLENIGLIPRKNVVKEDTERGQKLAEPSKSSEHLTLGVDGSGIVRSMPLQETTLSNRPLPSIDRDVVSGHNASWADDLEEDGGIEVTNRPNQSAAVDPSREKRFTPIRQPGEAPLPYADRAPQISAKSHGKISNPEGEQGETPAKAPATPTSSKKDAAHSIDTENKEVAHETGQSTPAPDTPAPSREHVEEEPQPRSQEAEIGPDNKTPPAEASLPPADRAPQISEHVGKEPQPRSQEAEIGPDNKTSPAKAKEQETLDGTDRLPLGSKGPSIPPGHVHKPKSETEGAYIPGNNSTRRKKRDKNKDGKVIFRLGGGGTGDDGSKGNLSGSRGHR